MQEDLEYPGRGWRPPEPIPSISPRTWAIILLGGGILVSGFDLWRRLYQFPLVPIPWIGYLIVGIWLLRSLNTCPALSIAGWWLSILWHVLLLPGSVLLLPFALALASKVSWLFLLPHFWVITALFMSVLGLRAEIQLNKSKR